MKHCNVDDEDMREALSDVDLVLPEFGSGFVYHMDVIEGLKLIPSDSIQSVVTSPPYWGLRDYETEGQIGLEDSVFAYIDKLVAVFEEAKRVLAPSGVMWLNMGDSYTSGGRKYRDKDKKLLARKMDSRPKTPEGMKPKDLIGLPWMLAFALRDAGWFLRTDIVWAKPNGNPESVTDRPTRNHEFIFMLTKNEKYYYDVEATMEKTVDGKGLRRKRSVWEVNTVPFTGAHFAVFPPALIEPCIAATTRPGDIVLDPFFGSGTTGQVAMNMGRNFIGIEISEKYIHEAKKRLQEHSHGYDLPVFTTRQPLPSYIPDSMEEAIVDALYTNKGGSYSRDGNGEIVEVGEVTYEEVVDAYQRWLAHE